MICKKCGADNLDKAKWCASCGASMTAETSADTEDKTVAVNDNASLKNEEETVKVPNGMDPTLKVNDNPPDANAYKEYFGDDPILPTKKSRKKIIIPIVLAVVAVITALGVCGYIFRDYVFNFYYGLRSAEVHQAYVYKRAAKEHTGELADRLFDMLILEDKTVDGKMTASLTEVAKGFVKEPVSDAFGITLNDIPSLELDYTYTKNSNMMQLDLGLTFGEMLEADAQAQADLEKEELTVDLPGISKNAYYYNYKGTEDQLLGIEGLSISKLMLAMPVLLPDNDLVVDSMAKYIEIGLLEAEDVERNKKDSIKAGGLEQKATSFTTKVDEDFLVKACEAMLEDLKEDEKLKKYITSSGDKIAKSYDEKFKDGDEAYDFVIDEIEKAIDELGDRKIDIELVTYINAAGDILGIEIHHKDYDEPFVMADLEKDEDRAVAVTFPLIFNDKTNIVTVLAEGKIKDDKFNGSIDCTVVREKETFKPVSVECKDLDVESLKAGELQGELKLKITDLWDTLELKEESLDSVADMIGVNASTVKSFIDAIDIGVEANNTEDKTDMELSLGLGGFSVMTVDITSETEDAKKIEPHTDTVDDPTRWMAGFDFTNPAVLLFMEWFMTP